MPEYVGYAKATVVKGKKTKNGKGEKSISLPKQSKKKKK